MILAIKAFLKEAFCKHPDYLFIRNIGGDEMRIHTVQGGNSVLAKSQWQCRYCGGYKYEGYRVDE